MFSRLVPGPLVRFFARPYVAGGSLEDALSLAAQIRKRGLLTTLDLLGEGVTHPEQIDRYVGIYEELIRAVAGERFADPATRPTVSIKPSAFTVGDQRAVFAPLGQLADLAAERGVGLTIDMEDREWTDTTLELAVGLYERGLDVGTVLQTRLNRTQDDLERIPAGMRVRLVIGIYPEPADVAITDKNEMKERLLSCGARLLERGAKVEFATHDEIFVERFAKEVGSHAPERCEVQLLLGVPRANLQEKLMTGAFGATFPVRLYVPFAIGWPDATAYLRRRMEESPSMMWLVLRNLADRRAERRSRPS